MPYTYPYPRPMVSVDILLLRRAEEGEKVLLIQRDREPFAGRWALPGGFVEENEPLEAAAQRELQEETGVKNIPLEQLGAFGDPGRDPRGHVITIVYGGILPEDASSSLRAGDDARRAEWFPVDRLPPLAFDHDQIISRCLPRLRERFSKK